LTQHSVGTNMRVIVVGGVAGGASTAARLRRLTEDVEVTLFERSSYVSFANCALPYYIGGEVPEWTQLQVTSPERLRERFNLNVFTNTEVVAIDRKQKHVTVRSTTTGDTTEYPYDHLVISVGCDAVLPRNIPGIKRDGHFCLKTMEDTSAIEQHIAKVHPRNIVVCGGGFIGLEISEQLANRNFNVTIVQSSEQVMNPFDPEMAEYLHQTLRKRGVDLRLGDGLANFEDASQGALASTVVLRSGTKIPADMVILAMGIRPATAFVAAAGISTSSGGHIRVNERMQTITDPCIWAVGDAIEVKNCAAGGTEMWSVPLAGPANRQGRIAAENIVGIPNASLYRGTFGTSGIRIWGVTAGCVGLTEKYLRRKGSNYKAVYLHPRQHADFYPDSSEIHMKLLFEPETGYIWGAQAVGEDGVDKRIDIIATAMQTGMTAPDLQDCELCYAPSFNAAKDPVNMAGMIAGNIMDGLVDTITPLELMQSVQSGAFNEKRSVLLDVRAAAEAEAHPVAIVPKDRRLNVELDSLRQQVLGDSKLQNALRKSQVIVSCNTGQRANTAARMLTLLGFSSVKVLTGSYWTYIMLDCAASRQVTHYEEKANAVVSVQCNELLNCIECAGAKCCFRHVEVAV